MERTIAAVAAIATLVVFASCSGMGSIPGLVDLYDRADPGGVLELEFHRSGAIREMEADVPIDDLPEKIRAAALERAPGATITGAEREITAAGPGWEVKLVHDGRNWEYVFNDRGRVVETEQELTRDETPKAVLHAAEGAVPEATFRSVEVIERGDHREFHVKLLRGEVSYKVVLQPDGKVIRAVREARAEIEIPLKG